MCENKRKKVRHTNKINYTVPSITIYEQLLIVNKLVPPVSFYTSSDDKLQMNRNHYYNGSNMKSRYKSVKNRHQKYVWNRATRLSVEQYLDFVMIWSFDIIQFVQWLERVALVVLWTAFSKSALEGGI